MDVRVSRGKEPAPTGFRRRIPLELTPEQMALLEQVEERFGTKRAALVAGIEALARVERVERELAEAKRACEQAQSTCDRLEERAAKAERALATSKGEQTQAKKAGAAVAGKEKAARAQASELARALEREREERAGLERELDALERELEKLEGQLFDALVCPRCGRLAPPEQWAEKKTAEGLLVYHRPCGFKGSGTLSNTSVFGVRPGG